MEPLAVILIVVVLVAAVAWAGHAAARSLRPVRRELWRRRIEAIEREADEIRQEEELEFGGAEHVVDDHAGEVRSTPHHQAAAGPGPQAVAASHEVIPRTSRSRPPGPSGPRGGDTMPEIPGLPLDRRRKAGLAPEDLDY